MKEVLEKFDRICRNRPFELAQAHDAGTVVVEYTGNFVPEELIHAAGAKAYPMWKGGEPDAPDAVLDESVRFLNPYARTLLGLYNLGLDPVAKFADIYAMSIPECHTARMAEAMELHGAPVVKVGVPADWKTPEDYEYYKAKVSEFRAVLEEKTGAAVTDEALRASIALFNRIRALLREIDEFRKLDNPPISGTDFFRVNHYAALCDPEVAVELLEELVAALREEVDTEATAERLPRIVVFGHVVAVGDYLTMKTLEDAGCHIVHEVMDEGMLWYEQDTSVEGDPFDAACRARYLDHLPTDNFQPAWDQRIDHVLRVVDDYRADAVLCYELLYDEIYDMEFNCFAKRMSSRDLPVMRLQTSYEYTREAMGHLRTKIETFVSSIEGGLQ